MAAEDKTCCEAVFWVYILTCIALVLFSGLISGLTIGLLSLSLVDLEVLAKAGQPKDRENAAKILPVVKNQHLLLCTLLVANALAMEALPIFLDAVTPAWVAILISVTLILAFGEILPQAVCARYGLKIGAKMAWLVRILVLTFFPICYPISKLLDWLLGKGHFALMRRAELKTLVHMHGDRAGKGGELSHHETTIISGALDLTQKTAYNAMTPISETFSLDINSKLDMHTMALIKSKGHSRVPIYSRGPANIIGIILVKNLITCHPEDEIPIRNVTIRKIPRVPDYLPLYNVLNEFQKGHSHMAVVVKNMKGAGENIGNMKGNVSLFEKMHPDGRHIQGDNQDSEVGNCNFVGDSPQPVLGELLSMGIEKSSAHPGVTAVHSPMSKRDMEQHREMHRDFKKWVRGVDDDVDLDSLPSYPSVEKVVGIITMEDVMEELLQEEILDETDEYVDDHHKIRINLQTRRSSPRSARRTPATSPLTSYHPSPILRSPLAPYILVPGHMPTLSSSPTTSLPGSPSQHRLSRMSPASHRVSRKLYDKLRKVDDV